MTLNSARRRSPIRLDACNLAASFILLGDKWSLLILRSALYGVCRFDHFQVELNIPRTVLSDRLKKLEARGLIDRHTYQAPGSRARTEYRLTAIGAELKLPFLAMTQWADAWLNLDRPKPLQLIDKINGLPVGVGLIDNRGLAISEDDVEVRFEEWARSS